jgi:arginine-tRNA-protein transferase
MTTNSEVRLIGKQFSKCSYCHSPIDDTSATYGFLINSLSAADYEALTFRGWSRSGKYVYRALIHESCCPLYIIRLNVADFKPSASQKKILRRMNRKIHQFAGQLSIETGEEAEISVETEPASFTVEKLELFRRYQVAVHGDSPEKISEESFQRFLVDSPLFDERDPALIGEGEWRRGTFHQLYRLAGRLVAVGVVDVVPSGLISVYCFYDVDLRGLALGKFAVLHELEECRRRGLGAYYLGYFSPARPKVAYKGDYRPSQLLCPSTGRWVDLEDCRPQLAAFAFSPLDPMAAAARERRAEIFRQFPRGEGRPSEEEAAALEQLLLRDLPALPLDRIPLVVGGRVLSLAVFPPPLREQLEPVLAEWLGQVGNELARRLVLRLA